MIDSASASRADGDLACAHCAKKFTRIENLRRHERTHTNKGAHVCDTCGRGFSRVDVLSRHAKTHEGHRVGDRQPDMGSIVTSESDPGTGTSSTGSQRVSAITTTRENLPELLNPTESIIWNPSLSNPPAGPGDARNSVDPFSQVDIASGGQDWTFGISEPGTAIQRHDLTSAFNGPPATVQPASNAYSQGNNSSFDFDLFCNINTANGDLAWDAGSLWSTQDAGTLNNFDWAAFGISPQDVRDLDAPVRAPPPISMPSSRAATPPIDQTEEDKWPTNYQPKRPFLIGTSGHLQEVIVDPLTVPELQRWSRFWLDESTYFKVIASLTSARRIPNADAFRMPKSLYTVNTLISYYFDKFLPQLPILHLPTFQITSAPPLLIAALMMIGACQTTLKGARAFCVDLIEVIRRTIADLFEMDSSNLRNADLLHVSLLTSFAGLWSGHQRSFELAELSRGILINLCRRTRLLESTGDNGPVFPTNAESGSSRWQTWVAAESRKRLGLAIFLFDALFPAFLDMPSYLSQGEMIHTVLPCDDRFWNAPNYHVWQAQLGVAPIPPAPYFVLGVTGLLIPKYAQDPPGPVQHLNPLAAICVINALYHHIWEFRSQLSVYFSLGVTVPFWEKDPDTEPREMRDGFEGRKNWLEGALDLWYKEYYNESRTDCLSLGGRALCHLGYIALNANLKDLFAASGSKLTVYALRSMALTAESGPEQAQRAMRPLRNWANSQSGSKAASHAIRLLKVLDFPRPSSSIYAPISVFVSTLCLWAYVSLRSPLQQTPEEQGPSSAIMAEVYGDEKTTSTQIMKGGVRYLSGCKEWRIGGALALVLAKMLEQGRGT